MQLPHVNASSEVYLAYTDHFEGAGEAWTDAEIITPAQVKAVGDALSIITASSTTLRGCVGATDGAERAATKLRARFRVRDVILDLRVMGLGDALLNGLCGRDRGHPKFRFVFDGGTASDIAGAKIREEPELAAGALDRYAKIEDFPGKHAAGDLLAEALKRSFATRADLDAAEEAENGAGSAELLARLEVRKALEQAYGILVAAFPGQRAFVESFFLKRERSGGKGEGEGGPHPPVDPAPVNP